MIKKFLILTSLILSSVSQADYIQLIRQVASQNGLDPDIAVAVAKVESSLNPKARGSLGEIGLFQIRPEFAKTAIYSPRENIKEGVRQLIYWRDNCPSSEFVICYNSGFRKPKYPKLHPYYKKVHAAMVGAR